MCVQLPAELADLAYFRDDAEDGDGGGGLGGGWGDGDGGPVGRAEIKQASSRLMRIKLEGDKKRAEKVADGSGAAPTAAAKRTECDKTTTGTSGSAAGGGSRLGVARRGAVTSDARSLRGRPAAGEQTNPRHSRTQLSSLRSSASKHG